MRILCTVVLLLFSNCFLTWAWYGHLKTSGWTIPVAVLISWMVALPEYVLRVPAHRIGHITHGGPLTASQLNVIREAIAITVCVVFAIVVLKERPRINEYIAFGLILAGVVVAMAGRGATPGSHETDQMHTSEPASHLSSALGHPSSL